MYIERPIDSLLLEWKNSDRRKPLLLRGARQVGKSWALEHLGETFDYFIEVNFEKRPEMLDVFEKIHEVHELASNLGIYYNIPVIPGRTLLFLDEIQKSTDAIQSPLFLDPKKKFESVIFPLFISMTGRNMTALHIAASLNPT